MAPFFSEIGSSVSLVSPKGEPAGDGHTTDTTWNRQPCHRAHVRCMQLQNELRKRAGEKGTASFLTARPSAFFASLGHLGAETRASLSTDPTLTPAVCFISFMTTGGGSDGQESLQDYLLPLLEVPPTERFSARWNIINARRGETACQPIRKISQSSRSGIVTRSGIALPRHAASET